MQDRVDGGAIGGQGAIAAELDAHHRAESAYVGDAGQGVGDLDEALADACADLPGACAEVFALHHVEGGERGGGRDGIAAEGAADGPGAGGIHDISATEDGGDGHSAAEGLGPGGEIGRDAEDLVGAVVAGAAESGLDFIEHEEDAVRITALAEAQQPRPGSGPDPAFTEDGLDDDCGDPSGFDEGVEGFVEAAELSLDEAGGIEARAAMKGVWEGQAVDFRCEGTASGLWR